MHRRQKCEGLQLTSRSLPCGVISPHWLPVPIFLPFHHVLWAGFCFGQGFPNEQTLFSSHFSLHAHCTAERPSRNPSPCDTTSGFFHHLALPVPLQWGCSPGGAGSLFSRGTFSPEGLIYLHSLARHPRIPLPRTHLLPRPASPGIQCHARHTQDLAHPLSPAAPALPLFSLLSNVRYASSITWSPR